MEILEDLIVAVLFAVTTDGAAALIMWAWDLFSFPISY